MDSSHSSKFDLGSAASDFLFKSGMPSEFQEVFINSDLKKFAHSVLRIQSFIDQITKLTPDSFFETEFSDEDYEALMTELKRIDLKIFEAESSHWHITLENLKWERDEERNN